LLLALLLLLLLLTSLEFGLLLLLLRLCDLHRLRRAENMIVALIHLARKTETH